MWLTGKGVEIVADKRDATACALTCSFAFVVRRALMVKWALSIDGASVASCLELQYVSRHVPLVGLVPDSGLANRYYYPKP